MSSRALTADERETLVSLADFLDLDGGPTKERAANALRKALTLLDQNGLSSQSFTSSTVNAHTLTTGRPLTKPLSARKVARARKIIAEDMCPALGIRHRYQPLGGIFYKCIGCGDVE